MTLDGANTGVRGAGGGPDEPAAAANPEAKPTGGRVENKVKVIGNYILTGKTLGKGNFARVEESQHTATKAKVAIKIINTDRIKEDYVRKNLLREAYIMRRLNHPNIVRLYETMKTRSLYCLVTECAEGGELLMHVKNDHGSEKRLPESVARPFIRQLMSALHYMHEKGIVHRDLKMENILLDKTKKHIKIVDFGLSNSREPGEFLSTHCGSPEYAAPELFVPGKVYGQEVDVWSLGVNMFAMLAGRLPFRVPRQGPNRRQRLLEQITHGVGPTQEQEGSHISSSAMDLVRQLLRPDPVERPSIVLAMKHPWITKNGLYPLHPYKEEGIDPLQHDRLLDLICARIDVTRRQISQSVSENRCDWVAAIYHLLHDQADGQTTLRDRTRQQLGQLLKTGNPAAGGASSSGAAAAAAVASEAAAQQQRGSGAMHLPHARPGSGNTMSGGRMPPPSSVSSQAAVTPGQVTTVNAVVRKLEAAVGQQLKTRPALKRNESMSHATRPSTQGGGLVRRQTFSSQRSREDQIDGGGMDRDGGHSRQQHHPGMGHNLATVNHLTANGALATPPIGSPIRTALTKRESLSTTHASVSGSSSGHVTSMAQRFSRQLSTPVISSGTSSARGRQGSPPKIHHHHHPSGQQQSPTKAGENSDQVVATPRKKYSFLRTRKTTKEKERSTPTKSDAFAADGITVLSELSEPTNKIVSEQVSPAGAASLSRSFALKPHTFTPDDHPNALQSRQVHSRSAQFGGQPALSSSISASTASRMPSRDGGQSFGQQTPSYGQRQAGMTSAWTQPAFTTIYTRQSPPSIRRAQPKGRPRSVSSTAGNPVFGSKAPFPPGQGEIDGELPPPGFRYSDHAMGLEDPHGMDDEFTGNTLPTRSRRAGAFGGIFGKALRMKKQGK